LDNSTLESRESFTDAVFMNKTYYDYQAFFDRLNTIHGHIHQFVGTVSNTHFHPNGGKPAVDPLFPLFHTFIDYIRLIRTDCYDFDLVPADDLDDYIPYAYDMVHEKDTTLDYKMDFSILCDESGGKSPRLCSGMSITPRLMYDVSPNRGFKIVYELGDFWNDNQVLQQFCGDNLNDSWWSNEMVDGIDSESDPDAEYQWTSEYVMRSINMLRSDARMSTMMLMVVCMMAIVVMRHCQMNIRREKEKEMGNGFDYGSVSGPVFM